MQLLFVANTAWNLAHFRKGLIRALRNDGHTVSAAAPAGPDTGALEEAGIPCHKVPLNGTGMNPLEDFALFLALFRLYRRERPGLVLHFTVKPNLYGSLAAGLLGIPSIASVTGLGYAFTRASALNLLVRLMYRAAFAFARTVFFQNPDDRELFVKGRIVSGKKARLTPGSGVDTSAFNPLPRQSQGREKVFLLIGRMLWDKGVGEFVEAARIVRREHPEAVFQLVGGAGGANPMSIPEEKVRGWDREGWVRYLGPLPDVRPAIREADCVVLPSYREGTPRTLLEAASMARPLIAAASPGCRETVDDGINGFLCRVRDPQDLAGKILDFLKLSPEDQRRMGQRGREKVLREFDERIVIERYREAIRALTFRPARGRVAR